jgi:hypothetical protein
MRRIFAALALLSIPVLMMLQVLQGFRYAVAVEEMDSLEVVQKDRLEENKRILAGIAVYDAPQRIYQVARESLELTPAASENVLQVIFPDETEALR